MADDVEVMSAPVRCTHCRVIYDTGKVTVTARYTDCSVWVAPCCGRTVDDRGTPWKSQPDITPVTREEAAAALAWPPWRWDR